MDLNIIIQIMLLEEEEDDEMLFFCMKEEKMRAPTSAMFKERSSIGFFKKLIKRYGNEKTFRNFFRVNFSQFKFLANLTTYSLKTPSYNRVKYPISPDQKLAITLRFLALGESFRTLALSFRISTSYISIILQSTLAVLAKKLMPICIPPLTPEDKKQKAEEFYDKWNFPNCLGAIDGKHIRINYKDASSTVLLAVVDANYKFIQIDVGSYGQEKDIGIFKKSKMGKEIKSGNGFPAPSPLPNSDKVVPYVYLGDDALRLDIHMMKPYPRIAAAGDERKATFNNRFSHARTVSQTCFTLLSQVFRIFYNPINLKPETVDHVIIVACCLHNLLRDAYLESNNTPYYEFDPSNVPPYKNVVPHAKSGGYANAKGFITRDAFMEYFSSNEAQVDLQENKPKCSAKPTVSSFSPESAIQS